MFSRQWAIKWFTACLICVAVGLSYFFYGNVERSLNDNRYGKIALACAAAFAIVSIVSALRKGVQVDDSAAAIESDRPADHRDHAIMISTAVSATLLFGLTAWVQLDGHNHIALLIAIPASVCAFVAVVLFIIRIVDKSTGEAGENSGYESAHTMENHVGLGRHPRKNRQVS